MLDGKATVSQFCFRPETPRPKKFRLGATIKALLAKLRLPTRLKFPQLGSQVARSMAGSSMAGALDAAIGFATAAQIEPVYESFEVNDLFFLLLLFCTALSAIAGMLRNLVGMAVAAMISGVALNLAWLLFYASRPGGFLHWRWDNFWAVDLYMYPLWGLAASLALLSPSISSNSFPAGSSGGGIGRPPSSAAAQYVGITERCSRNKETQQRRADVQPACRQEKTSSDNRKACPLHSTALSPKTDLLTPRRSTLSRTPARRFEPRSHSRRAYRAPSRCRSRRLRRAGKGRCARG